MDDFKDVKTLYNEYHKKGPSRHGIKRTKDITLRICEYFTPEGCEPSKEAVELGLAKTIFPCGGTIPPYCAIRQKLAAGITIQKICKKQ